MKATQRETEGTKIQVLSVGLGPQDHASLRDILTPTSRSTDSDIQWQVESCGTLPAALAAIQATRIPVVLCEREFNAHSWQHLWEPLNQLSDPPCLIVTSRMADEYLWAEALNLGAYDVLARPFDPTEVVRVFNSAWLHRTHRKDTPGRAKTATPRGTAFVAAV